MKREHLPFPVFEVKESTLLKRLTFVVHERKIVKVFYPVFPPDKNPEEVIAWLKKNKNAVSERKKQFLIRAAEPSDAESVARVLAESFAEYESSYTPRAYAATVPSIDEIKRRFGEEKIWVAVCGERIVGTVAAVPKNDSLYVRSMAIVPTARGQKIGEKLLTEIENYAADRNCWKLFLNTTPFLKRAIRLYKKFGFVRRGTDDLFGTSLVPMENLWSRR